MIIFGADVHPVFQAGLPIEALPSVGIEFLSVKVSQGTSSVYLDQGALGFLQRGVAAGMLCVGYHWLEPSNEDAQASVFAAALQRAGNLPGVSDVEDITPARVPTLNISGIRAFHNACTQRGARVPFMYLPHWYWQAIGSPDLTGLPQLWASSYPTNRTGTPQQLYPLVDDARWASYGGQSIGPLQFASSGILAGYQPVDVNAYQGSRAQLAKALGLHTRYKERPEMIKLPSTATPVDPKTSPLTWPQRNFDVPWNVVGGWEGDAAFSFGVQDWNSGRPDAVRGLLLLASWMMPGGKLIPVDPIFTVSGGGQALTAHTLTKEYPAPAGCVGVTLNYAAPNEAYVAIGRSG